jgi:hypothetical protein
MDYNLRIFDNISIGVAIPPLMVILASAASYNSRLFVISSVIFCICLFLLADVIKLVIRIIRKEHNMLSIFILILRVLGIIFIGMFLYNFVVFDYKYYKTNENKITFYLAVAICFIIFDRILSAIKHRKRHKERSYSEVQIAVTIYSIIIEIIILIFFLYQAIIPKNVGGLSNICMPSRIYVVQSTSGQISFSQLFLKDEKLLKNKASKECIDNISVKLFYDEMYNRACKMVTILEKLKINFIKSECNYAEVYFKYDKKETEGNLVRLTILDEKVAVIEGSGLINGKANSNKVVKLYMDLSEEELDNIINLTKR